MILPLIYRIQILEKYYLIENSTFVIDKLSKAHVKNRNIEQAEKFLKNCYVKKELSNIQLKWLMNDVALLNDQLQILPIANDLEDAKINFNELLPYIDEKKRSGFICLISSILNGKESN